MKALSLKQPWASLVMKGEKEWETRSWDTAFRGPLLIHASLGKKDYESLIHAPLTETNKFFKQVFQFDSQMPFGAILGHVHLVATARTEDQKARLSLKELAFGDYTTGRYMWKLADPVMFKEPIPYKGALQLWKFPDEILEQHGLFNPSHIFNR